MRGKEKGGGDGGVERTHREARSHDLMNELAWLLASVVGYALTLPRRRLSSFARRLSAAKARETRAMPAMNGQRLNFRTSVTRGEEPWIDANRERIDVSVK